MKKDVKTVFDYSAEFKINVILDIQDNGLSLHEAVRKYWHVTARCDIDKYRKTVRNWQRLYAKKGANGFMSTKISKKSVETILAPSLKNPEEYDLAKLLEENEYLRMENMYLKKLRALILKEEQEKHNRCK